MSTDGHYVFCQTSIEVQEFCDGEPDILAHCSAAIIDRMNFAGNKTEEALKALCRREKGLEVEVIFSNFNMHYADEHILIL